MGNTDDFMAVLIHETELFWVVGEIIFLAADLSQLAYGSKELINSA